MPFTRFNERLRLTTDISGRFINGGGKSNKCNQCKGEKSQTSYNIILYNIFLHSVHWLHENAVLNTKRNATNASRQWRKLNGRFAKIVMNHNL